MDWHSDTISLDTPVIKSYKMTQNVRRFFRQHVGENFHFNVDFMIWMKANIGKITMQDAVNEARRRNMAG